MRARAEALGRYFPTLLVSVVRLRGLDPSSLRSMASMLLVAFFVSSGRESLVLQL